MSTLTTSPSLLSTLKQPSSAVQDPVRIAETLSGCRKAQIPYYTGWDAKPNSCLQLVAEIENDDSRRKNALLDRACRVIKTGQQRREREEEDAKLSAEIVRRIRSSNSPKANPVYYATSPISNTSGDKSRVLGEDNRRNSINDKSKNRSIYDYEDGDSSLSFHHIDSPYQSANQSLKSLSLSIDQLNLSEIKQDTSQEHNNFLNTSSKSRISARSSTPLRSALKKSVTKTVDTDRKSTPQRRSGTFSIREEDESYSDDDEDDQIYNSDPETENNQARKETPPTLQSQSPIHIHLQHLLEKYESDRIEVWRENVTAKFREDNLERYNKKIVQECQEKDSKVKRTDEQYKKITSQIFKRRLELKANLENQQKLKQLEFEQEDKQLELDRNKVEEEIRNAKAKLEKAKAEAQVAAAKELEEKNRLQRQKEDESAAKVQAEAAALLQEQALQAQAKVEEQQQVIPVPRTAPSGIGVPSGFQNAVLKSDLQVYIKLQQQLEEVKEAVKNISSTNEKTKAFYFAAMKVVNTPINSISNLSDEHLQQKIQHFIHLLEGRPVYIGDTMLKPFVASSEQNGDLFILNLLAFRFVKKSEAEVTRGSNAIRPLATLGVQLIRRFPVLGPLIRANFYKMCPFIVPLSYPRHENMSNEQYASSLGHEQLGGTERTIQQVLLERLTGYCILYATMVDIVEKHHFTDLGPENTEFFSLKEIWRILAATMRLDPQFDVTCTVIQALLQTSSDSLFQLYRAQYRKLLNELANTYLLKLRNITPPGKAASLTRLELFLESQWPKLQ